MTCDTGFSWEIQFNVVVFFLPFHALLDLEIRGLDENYDEGEEGEGPVNPPTQIHADEKIFQDEKNWDGEEISEMRRDGGDDEKWEVEVKKKVAGPTSKQTVH